MNRPKGVAAAAVTVAVVLVGSYFALTNRGQQYDDGATSGPFSSRTWDIDPDGTVHENTNLDDTIPPRIGTPASGVVTAWNDDEGWGVIESADTPGGCWTFYSALHPDEVINAQPGDSFKIDGGIHGLEVGEQVDFEWEPVIDQDGYKFRAIKVRPQREIPPWRVERIGG
ncbi:hypothetical protein R4P70_30695 [Rhodococcus sp. IEGM 1241]|uniref:hypothetical protein n=1 Tax=Rhodococcus sp. IEGM 1241 TaxID=3082228 RepID=UPI0029537B24|nr:hypothetical protein [Rhodococcus sp. IEGM 1241]MDV8015694.1 hypothetical protein [Rhodococcus sp. IEGM 1241]